MRFSIKMGTIHFDQLHIKPHTTANPLRVMKTDLNF